MDKTKARLSREIANVFSNDFPYERKRANLVARPFRIAFILSDKLSPDNLLQILVYISSIWGGYYSCLIATDGIKISKADWENLYIYSPDKVVLCATEGGVISNELVNRIKNEISPFSVIAVENIKNGKDIFDISGSPPRDRVIQSIPLIYPMVHLLDQQKQPIEVDKSMVRIPRIDQHHSLALFVAAQIGIVSDSNLKVFKDGFKAKEIKYENNKVGEYLSFVGEFENWFTPFDMTKKFLSFTESISMSLPR